MNRRRRVVGVTTGVGAVLLGAALSTRPGSRAFYLSTTGVAATWTLGGLLSGPLQRGWVRTRDQRLRRPVLAPVVTGVGAYGVFHACALLAGRVPSLQRAIEDALALADEGDERLVLLVALANGLGEEVFFRGALYEALEDRHPVALSTLVYTLTTVPTRNPALVLAAAVMGTLFGLQRRATYRVQAPVLTHLIWSVLMIRRLPRRRVAV